MSFTDHRDFPMTSWSDMSDWPLLESMAAQVSHDDDDDYVEDDDCDDEDDDGDDEDDCIGYNLL